MLELSSLCWCWERCQRDGGKSTEGACTVPRVLQNSCDVCLMQTSSSALCRPRCRCIWKEDVSCFWFASSSSGMHQPCCTRVGMLHAKARPAQGHMKDCVDRQNTLPCRASVGCTRSFLWLLHTHPKCHLCGHAGTVFGAVAPAVFAVTPLVTSTTEYESTAAGAHNESIALVATLLAIELHPNAGSLGCRSF